MSTSVGVCESMNGAVKKYERLPSHTRPLHYSIALQPDLKTFVVTGSVSIDLEIKEATENLKLHGKSLQINKARLDFPDGRRLSDLRVETSDSGIMSVDLQGTVSPQKAKLTMDFVGELGENMKGFYRSFYKGVDGKEGVLASTHFEATSARYAFPCWDEPIYKATFDVQLTVDKSLTALSNMNIENEQNSGEDKKIVKYARTPLMSTYLIAFVVGDLEYIETKSKADIPVRVYTVPGKKKQGEFALEIATRALDWYSEWFDIPYPLPKCDLVAVPDFAMGAMENWGLVTFREVALLCDKAKTSEVQKRYIASVVAHELAHFWFGDLVTMKWWTDLWLKEGFAMFMEFLFIYHNYPDFKMTMTFARNEISSALELDALRSSHPIEVEIDDPNELDEIYDAITYAKSNCMNRMLYEFIGEDKFQAGLRIYLKRHQYSNAVTVDLWAALAEASGVDIKTMMSGWTQQMGFPVVTVTQQKAEGESRVLSLHQTRFIADGSEDEKNPLWIIPVTTIKGPNAVEGDKILLESREGSLTVNDVSPSEYIKLNSRTGGVYRVAYSEELFAPLISAFHTLPPLDRFGIASDTFALMLAGRYSAREFLALVDACSAEEEFAVWGALDDGLASLSSVLGDGDEQLKRRLDAFLVNILAPLGDRLGWMPRQGDDGLRNLLRGLILGRLSKTGHKKTIEAALSLFSEQGAELHPDIRPVVFSTVARSGDQQQYEQLQKIFESTGFPEVERNTIIAMGQTPKKDLLEGFFKWAIDGGAVRNQDLMYVFLGASASPMGREFSWNYFKNSQPVLLKRLNNPGESLYQKSFKFAADGFSSELKAKEVEEFFCSCSELSSEMVKPLHRPIKQVVETIRLNVRLLNDNAKAVDVYLSERGF